MTATLLGRIQTRIFLLVTVGGVWTLIITPFLPDAGPPTDPFVLPRAGLGAKYSVTYIALAVVIVAGIGWELLYHGLQQFRWEKDWPAMFGLLSGINEGIVDFFILKLVLPSDLSVSWQQWVILFPTMWILVWIAANGPMRVPFIRWRFRGGRII